MTYKIQTCQQSPKHKEKATKPAKHKKKTKENQRKTKERLPKTGQSSQNEARENPDNADRIVLKLWTLASRISLIRPVLFGQLKRGRIGLP